MNEIAMSEIPGAANVVQWFGYWPTFHDAEIIEVSIRREGKSSLRIHTWRSTSQIDPKSHYINDRHAVVTFGFEQISDLELTNFNHQNVIGGLQIEHSGSGFRVKIDPCFGLDGYIEAAQLEVSLEPGNPKENNGSAPA